MLVVFSFSFPSFFSLHFGCSFINKIAPRQQSVVNVGLLLRRSGEELGDAEAIEAVVDVAPSGDLLFQAGDSLLQLAVLLLENSLLALGRLNKRTKASVSNNTSTLVSYMGGVGGVHHQSHLQVGAQGEVGLWFLFLVQQVRKHQLGVAEYRGHGHRDQEGGDISSGVGCTDRVAHTENEGEKIDS